MYLEILSILKKKKVRILTDAILYGNDIDNYDNIKKIYGQLRQYLSMHIKCEMLVMLLYDRE